MAEIITIYQSQSVIFTDITLGGVTPYERLWSLEGADVNSATGATAQGVYNSPGDYNVFLTITDYNNVINATEKINLINVLPAYITASFTKSSTSIEMSETIDFTDTSTGGFVNPNTWVWNIGGSGFTSQNVTNFKLDDWVNVQGAIISDSPGYSRQVTAQLTASNGSIYNTTSENFTMSKVGAAETVYINTDGVNSNWINASSVVMSSYTGSDVSLPLNNRIFEIGIGDLSGATQIISNFHSTNEVCNLVMTGLSGTETFTYGIEQVDGILGINSILYGTGEPAIDLGNYLTPGLKSSIFFMDTNKITNLIDNYNWSEELIEAVISSSYPLVHSAQSWSMGGTYQKNPDDNTNSNPLIMSPEYFESNGATGYKYTLTLTLDGGAQTSIIDFDANGGTGNSTNGLFYKMQNATGPAGVTGIAEMINTAISIDITGGTGTLEAFASNLYTANTTGIPDEYNGIAIMIKDSHINSVEFIDNSDVLNSLALFPEMILPFAASLGFMDSCSGISTKFDTSALSYKSGFGTRITYGGSIF